MLKRGNEDLNVTESKLVCEYLKKADEALSKNWFWLNENEANELLLGKQGFFYEMYSDIDFEEILKDVESPVLSSSNLIVFGEDLKKSFKEKEREVLDFVKVLEDKFGLEIVKNLLKYIEQGYVETEIKTRIKYINCLQSLMYYIIYYENKDLLISLFMKQVERDLSNTIFKVDKSCFGTRSKKAGEVDYITKISKDNFLYTLTIDEDKLENKAIYDSIYVLKTDSLSTDLGLNRYLYNKNKEYKDFYAPYINYGISEMEPTVKTNCLQREMTMISTDLTRDLTQVDMCLKMRSDIGFTYVFDNDTYEEIKEIYPHAYYGTKYSNKF